AVSRSAEDCDEGVPPFVTDVQTLRCPTPTDNFRREQWDLDIHDHDGGGMFEQVIPRRASHTWLVVLVFLIAAAAAAYIGFRLRRPAVSQAAPLAAASRAAEPVRPLGGEAAAVDLPPLDESDGVVADLVRKLSSHPQVAAWLTTRGLVRNFTVVVSNIAEGQTPAKWLPPLRPVGPYRV